MINYISPRNPSDREDLELMRKSRLEWIKICLRKAIDRLPNHPDNPARWKQIKEIEEQLKR